MRKSQSRRDFLNLTSNFGRVALLEGSVLGLVSCGGGGGGASTAASADATCGIAFSGTVPPATDPARAVRAAPHANFEWFTRDFTVTASSGPKGAAVQEDLLDVFLRKYRAKFVGTIAYVDGAIGSDTNSGCTRTSAYRTIDMALRSSPNCVIHVAPGYYTSWTGFRHTDKEGTRPKMLVAPEGGVTVAYAGDTVSTLIWQPNSSFSNVYQTTLATTNTVARVLDANSMDQLGLPKPMPRQASLSALDGSGYGWWHDEATRTLHVRLGTLNVDQVKSRLTAIYSADNDNQFRITGSILYIEGITLLGYPSLYNALDQLIPEIFLKNVIVRYAEGSSRAVFGGRCYSQGGTYYRSKADHANYNVLNGVISNGVEINDQTWYAGDTDTFGSGPSQPNNLISTALNKNGSSSHDSHVVRVNGTHNECYGPPIADTGSSYSWCMGTQTGFSHSALGNGQQYGFVMQSNNAWLDGCQAGPTQGALINSDSGANVRLSNCFGVPVTSNGGTIAPYSPSSS